MKPLSQGYETSHSERIYIVDVHRRSFSLIDQKIRNYGGLNLDKLGIFVYLYYTLSAALLYEALVLGI